MGTAGFGVSGSETAGESNAWEFWDSATIARVTQCPRAAVEQNWPAICDALVASGGGSRNSLAAAIATVAVETASTFAPVREAFWLSEEWRKANLRYWPGYGRGYIQLTWLDPNYKNAGAYIGVDLVNNPDLAMEPDYAARIFAWYWTQARNIPPMADRKDWRAVRQAVQGADAGLDRLIAICTALLG